MTPHHSLLVLVLAAVTSLVALAMVRRRGTAGVGAALVAMVELVGATTLFFVANLSAGIVVVLASRKLAVYFATLYEVADVTLLILSMLQAATFEAWRRGR